MHGGYNASVIDCECSPRQHRVVNHVATMCVRSVCVRERTSVCVCVISSLHFVFDAPALVQSCTQVDKVKEKHEVDPKKRAKKKKEEDRIVKEIQGAQQRLAGLNIRSTLLMMVTMIGIFWGLNSYYSGVVVAKLPFEPISFITKLSHRNLPGNDLTAVSYTHLTLPTKRIV